MIVMAAKAPVNACKSAAQGALLHDYPGLIAAYNT
jgi:hypothetical protein